MPDQADQGKLLLSLYAPAALIANSCQPGRSRLSWALSFAAPPLAPTREYAVTHLARQSCPFKLNIAQEELAKWATDMGAAHKFDLTSDVTHLVVGHIDTQKYKYVAKERPDVKVVLPAWVAAVRDSWLKGGETDVERLEEEYRVPTFHGLRICITGFEDCKQPLLPWRCRR